MNKHISKRAIGLEDLKNTIFHLWHPNEGPFQNIFKLLSYATPFIPGLGWTIFIIEKVASLTGYGLENLGKYLDQQLGLDSGSNIDPSHIEKGGQLLENLVSSKMASASKEELVKIAFFGSLLKFAIPKALKLILKVVSLLLMAVGVDQIKDLYTKIQSQGGVQKYVVEKAEEAFFNPQIEPTNEGE